MTQELIPNTLRVRRFEVTQSALKLQNAGLIGATEVNISSIAPGEGCHASHLRGLAAEAHPACGGRLRYRNSQRGRRAAEHSVKPAYTPPPANCQTRKSGDAAPSPPAVPPQTHHIAARIVTRLLGSMVWPVEATYVRRAHAWAGTRARTRRRLGQSSKGSRPASLSTCTVGIPTPSVRPTHRSPDQPRSDRLAIRSAAMPPRIDRDL